MKFVTMRDIKINPSNVLDRLSREDIVVTRSGKPAAALLYLDEDLLDDFIIAHHKGLQGELREAREEYLVKGGIDHKSMKKRIAKRRG
jgi:prevent-host-death family protein